MREVEELIVKVEEERRREIGRLVVWGAMMSRASPF